MSLSPPPFRQNAPALDVPIDLQIAFSGWVGERLRANEQHWLIPAPATNPGMIEVFAYRNSPPIPGLTDNGVPWIGEFAGKYLISAVQSLRLRQNPELERVVSEFVIKLIGTQGNDGSLGMPRAWDLWGQYHVMLGLLRWYEYKEDKRALTACVRAADLACARYLATPSAIASDNPKDGEKNQAVAHVLALLYEWTGERRYLELTHAIEAEWSKPGAADYINRALNGHAFYENPSKRWESLHDVQAIAELYLITGNPNYRSAFEQIWRSIVACDRHVTGGFSSGEVVTGNAFEPLVIETCGSVAWMALTIDMLRLSADSTAADELELSLFNAILGAQSPDGRLWTYDTPMGGIPVAGLEHASLVGYRLPAYYELWWQGPDRHCQLSCCAANGPRGLGCLSEWAIMSTTDGVVINYYGPLAATLQVPAQFPSAATGLRLTIETAYPLDGVVQIKVRPDKEVLFTIALRIPVWSQKTNVMLNGVRQSDAVPGSYYKLRRAWRETDVITLTLDMTTRTVAGRNAARNLVAVYRGPLLLAFDRRFNWFNPLAMPGFNLSAAPRIVTYSPDAAILVTFPTPHGDITLCDFASAGQSDAGKLAAMPDVSGTWQFSRSDRTVDFIVALEGNDDARVTLGDDVIAEQIQLLPGGGIHGHSHQNEAKWKCDGDTIAFYNASSVPSTRFTLRTQQHGKQMLSGTFLFDSRIRHVLTQVDLALIGKDWQFWRKDTNGATILSSLIRLLPGGRFDRVTHPNETRWGIEEENLVFYAADGTPSTKFTSLRVRNGRVERSGKFLFDTSITHYLSEVDLNITSLIWRFKRKGETESIAERVRLLPNKKLDGYSHFNETSWDYDGSFHQIMFLDGSGAVSTRFGPIRARSAGDPPISGVMSFEGSFRNRAVTHILEEQCPGWSIDRNYIVWLPTND